MSTIEYTLANNFFNKGSTIFKDINLTPPSNLQTTSLILIPHTNDENYTLAIKPRETAELNFFLKLYEKIGSESIFEDIDITIKLRSNNLNCFKNYDNISPTIKHKYIHQYIPQVILNIENESIIKRLENELFNLEYVHDNENINISNKMILNKYNIIELDTLLKLSETKKAHNNIVINTDIDIHPVNDLYDKMQKNISHTQCPSVILPYNHTYELYENHTNQQEIKYYDIFRNNFGDNCSNIIFDDLLIEESVTLDIIVILNIYSIHCQCIEGTVSEIDKISKILLNNNTIGFVELFRYTVTNSKVRNFIMEEFNGINFYTFELLNNAISSTASYITAQQYNSIYNVSQKNVENLIITKYINDNYTITNDTIHKMKASTLVDVIIHSNIFNECNLLQCRAQIYDCYNNVKYIVGTILDNFVVNNIQTYSFLGKENNILYNVSHKNIISFGTHIEYDSGFKNRLAKYLINIPGLNKKRYNDGIYYYGLQPKNNDIL